MLKECGFCGAECNLQEVDSSEDGFWCEDCDGFTYFDPMKEKHRFTLILENKSSKDVTVPTPSIKLSKRVSPLRYPGGKSKIINYLYSKLQFTNTKTLVGAYAGGASVELSLLHAGVVEQLVLNDYDFGVYALFWTIKHAPYELIERIRNHVPTHKDFFQAQSIVKSDYVNCDLFEAAWSLLVVNRLAYSGIYAANPLGGREGTNEDLLSRWNPRDLINRIKCIHQMSDRITLYNMDACELIEEMYWLPQATLFIDPPYVQKGKQLYHHYYKKEDHIKLNVLLDSLYQGCPGADIILTYDDDPLVECNYMYPDVEKISRIYSV